MVSSRTMGRKKRQMLCIEISTEIQKLLLLSKSDLERIPLPEFKKLKRSIEFFKVYIGSRS